MRNRECLYVLHNTKRATLSALLWLYSLGPYNSNEVVVMRIGVLLHDMTFLFPVSHSFLLYLGL